MWYIVAAAAFFWLYFDRTAVPRISTWLHQPVTGSHAAHVHGLWLAGILVVILIICVALTSWKGELVPGAPRDHSWVMALAFAFVGFLWYLVQTRKKPVTTIVRPTVTVTATPGPVVVNHSWLAANGELVLIFGIVGVIVIAVLYFIVRYVL